MSQERKMKRLHREWAELAGHHHRLDKAFADYARKLMLEITPRQPTEFEADCLKERGRVLRGRYAHYCQDWDGLTIDETCSEWPCACAGELVARASDLLPTGRTGA